MVLGTFLLYRGQEHLVYHSNIFREKPLEGVGRIPLLLLPTVDLWNFNAHSNDLRKSFAEGYAKSTGMLEEPINIIEGGEKNIYGRTKFEHYEYFRLRDVPDDAPLSTLVDRMFFYDVTQPDDSTTQSLGFVLRKYPNLTFSAPPQHMLSSELKNKGLVFNQNVSHLHLQQLTDIILSLEREGNQVSVARDAYNSDGSVYPNAVSIYTK